MAGNNPEELATNAVTVGDSLSKAAPKELSRPELLGALDYEIKRIEDENRRPGWSSWALQGGIASCIWLALSNYNDKSNLQVIGEVFVLGMIVIDFAFILFGYVASHKKERRSQKRYIFVHEEPAASPFILVSNFVRYFVTLIVYCLLSDKFKIPFFVPYLIITIIGGVLLVIIRMFPIFTEKQYTLKVTDHVININSIIWGSYISAYVYFVLLPPTNLYVSEFKIGMLLAGVFYLIGLIATGAREKPALENLKQIRSEFAFGLISIEEATKEADREVFGFTSEGVLDFNFNKISKQSIKALEKINAIEALLASIDSEVDLLTGETSQIKDDSWKLEARKIALKLDEAETALDIFTKEFLNVVKKNLGYFNKNIPELLKVRDANLKKKAADTYNVSMKLVEVAVKCNLLLKKNKERYLELCD